MNNKDTFHWEGIKETENFIVEYDKDEMLYRVSYFEDNHYCDDIVFKGPECLYGCPGMMNEYEAIELGMLKR